MAAAADDCFPDSVTLSDSQYDVLKTIMQGKSVFYTGAAGTGKSFILRILQEILHHMSDKEAIAFTSPTVRKFVRLFCMCIYCIANLIVIFVRVLRRVISAV
jgi:energy-coupling factor transporter ATP-binding protein EcfA2